MTRRLFLLLASAALVFAQPRSLQPPLPQAIQDRAAYIRENYTKFEFQIPMRDGVKLFTSVYSPKDKSQSYPILLMRTPYTVAPYGIDNYRASLGPASEKFMREGFIFAYQDVRGKGRSEGVFVHVRPHIPNKKSNRDVDESSDTYDTIEWLTKNIPGNNGRVGMYGISYPGFYAAQGAIDSHPALKATSPQAPVINWFIGDDFRHNGALFLTHAFNFLGSFGRPRGDQPIAAGSKFEMEGADAYAFHLAMGGLPNYDEKLFKGQVEFWKDLISNDTYSQFWKGRDLRQYVTGLKPAMLTVGGWFDAEDVFGPLHLYGSAEKQNPGAVNLLVEGPWSHGGWARTDGATLGNANFASNTSKFFQDEIEFPFFLYYLKGKGDGNQLPEAYVFETGRNEWHKMDAWPPRQAKARTYYFQPAGKLAATVPEADGAFDQYISDPNKPVPFLSYPDRGMNYNYMTGDQRHAAARPDVLVYQTEPLDKDLTVAGPLKATLHVSTTGTDSDWVVKLIDVFPNDAPDPNPNPANVRMAGYQMLIRGEPFRGKFRNGFDKPEPFTPGKLDKVEFELPDIYHTFRRGHRLMVQVQSSWFPLIDRNPQKFMPIQDAKAGDFTPATQRVYRSSRSASGITVPVLD
jgi:hypothetical protein